MANNKQSHKDIFIENVVYKKNVLSAIFKIIANFILFFLNILAGILIKTSELTGWIYTKIWPFLNVSSYDHRFDYLRGIQNYGWYERAVIAMQKIKAGGTVLDAGCGDGIYSGMFYSTRAKMVDAIDIDKAAIEHARKYYSRKNVNFKSSSIQNWLKKEKKYDVIFMFAVIEHFEPAEGLKILREINKSLIKDGVFFGSTPLFSDVGAHNFEHHNEFNSEAKLAEFLKKVFRKVSSYTSDWPDGRHECYFECKK